MDFYFVESPWSKSWINSLASARIRGLSKKNA